MAKLNTGSICLTELIEQAKKKHSAFTKAANGKIYFNINLWQNDEADKYGNTFSIQLNSKKDLREAEGKIYIGNAKPLESKEPEAISNNDAVGIPESDDLPF